MRHWICPTIEKISKSIASQNTIFLQSASLKIRTNESALNNWTLLFRRTFSLLVRISKLVLQNNFNFNWSQFEINNLEGHKGFCDSLYRLDENRSKLQRYWIADFDAFKGKFKDRKCFVTQKNIQSFTMVVFFTIFDTRNNFLPQVRFFFLNNISKSVTLRRNIRAITRARVFLPASE